MTSRVFRLIGLGLVLLLALATPSHALFGGDELELEGKAAKLAKEAIRGGYNIVETAELKTWIDAKKDMLIVDTMPLEDSFKKNHVPGAKQFLFPVPDMTSWDAKETAGKSQDDFAALLGPDKNKLIVFYCGFVKCTRSHNGAVWAKQMGYTNVYRYPGGIMAWMDADYPIEKGE